MPRAEWESSRLNATLGRLARQILEEGQLVVVEVDLPAVLVARPLLPLEQLGGRVLLGPVVDGPVQQPLLRQLRAEEALGRRVAAASHQDGRQKQVLGRLLKESKGIRLYSLFVFVDLINNMNWKVSLIIFS